MISRHEIPIGGRALVLAQPSLSWAQGSDQFSDAGLAVLPTNAAQNKKSIYAITTDGRLVQINRGAGGWHFDCPAEGVGNPDLRSGSAPERIERRLSAILMADVAGYSRLIGTDDEGTVAQLNAHHAVRVEPKIKNYRGRVVRTTGDGLLVLFESVVAALRCSVEIQRAMADWNVEVPRQQRIEFRMGISVGDIIEGPSVHGDAVNIAARLETLADVGGICVSERVLEDVQGSMDTLGATFEDAGPQKLKNIARPVRVYRVRLDEIAKAVQAAPLRGRSSIANQSPGPALGRIIHRLLFYLRCGRKAGFGELLQNGDVCSASLPDLRVRHISRVLSPRPQLEPVT